MLLINHISCNLLIYASYIILFIAMFVFTLSRLLLFIIYVDKDSMGIY